MGPPGIERTPCGRIPNTPLRNWRHEEVAHAIVRGLNYRDAGLAAGYKKSSFLNGNIGRLRRTPVMCERIAEIAAADALRVDIYDSWVLNKIKLFAEGSLAQFWKRHANGQLLVDEHGNPTLDLLQASEAQLACISELSHGKYGLKLKIHDPKGHLEMLARYRGLFKDQLPPIGGGVSAGPIEIRLVKPQGDD